MYATLRQNGVIQWRGCTMPLRSQTRRIRSGIRFLVAFDPSFHRLDAEGEPGIAYRLPGMAMELGIVCQSTRWIDTISPADTNSIALQKLIAFTLISRWGLVVSVQQGWGHKPGTYKFSRGHPHRTGKWRSGSASSLHNQQLSNISKDQGSIPCFSRLFASGMFL
jgi:hypothetical protein